jgi:hypothetical protein
VCWGLGILIFYLCFDRYKEFIGEHVTLHGFLGHRYGQSVRITASWLTIIGFIGFAIAETYFGSKVLLTFIQQGPIFYGIIAATLLFVYGYICYGGQVSSIRTDQLQLIFSYGGVFGVMLYFLYLLLGNGIRAPTPLVLGFFILAIWIPGIFWIRKFKFIRLSEAEGRTTNLINACLNVAIVVILILLWGTAIFKIVQRDSRPGGIPTSSISKDSVCLVCSR